MIGKGTAMRAERNRNRVKGYLDVRGKKIVNGEGEEVLLTGWGVGNWLLCEGYMWWRNCGDRFDRPRRIEAVIEELAGKEYAAGFWQQFRECYFTEEDVRDMARLGYNSVRIPINSRLFLEEGPGLHWVEEGFLLLDRCLDWCEKHRLYAFLDLHGAPGGQTGANIDDSLDDRPRLLMDQDCFDKGIALWKKLAERYKDRWIVGGYDLLNEPLRPKRKPEDTDVDDLLPRLQEFYETAIREIRQVDDRHLFTLEGHHWATEVDIFCKKYDPKVVIHFHRYGCLPDIESYRSFLEIADRWDCPLWLGETGENVPEWFAAMYPLAEELGIGYNLWPWKKVNCINSPCSVKEPEGWQSLLEYTLGGAHPGFEAAQRILDEYLENSKLAHCVKQDTLTNMVFRQPGCVIRGTDFDELPGKAGSYSGLRQEESLYPYRRNTGMEMVKKFPDHKEDCGFDSGFRKFVLGLSKGEFACYTLHDVTAKAAVSFRCYGKEDAIMRASQDGRVLGEFVLKAGEAGQTSERFPLEAAERSVVKLETISGKAEVEAVETFAGAE